MTWFLANLTAIGVVVGMLTGIAGLAVSVWTRVDQRREARERRRERDPYFTAFIGPAADDGWRIAKLIFYNPSETAFEPVSVKVVRPLNGKISPRSPANGAVVKRDETVSARALAVKWRVDVPNEPTKSIAQASLFCKIPDGTEHVSLRVSARMISSTRRQFTMQAEATITNAKP